ncbi:MAG: DUF2007 domain-containing protein [Gammaproteobacteria bacterium]|jgi:hypothetical protein
MNEADLITIASYSFPHEAHVARANLDAAGIPAFIADEHTINMQWLYSNALGGVRLQVPAQYVDKAREVLSQDYSHLLVEQFGEDIETRCSRCGSKNLQPYTRGRKPAFVVFLLLGFPLFFYQHGLRCKDCGHFEKT